MLIDRQNMEVNMARDVVEVLATLTQQDACCVEVVEVAGVADEDDQVFGVGKCAAAFDVELGGWLVILCPEGHGDSVSIFAHM
jgi:hypothetical protein